MTLISCPAMTGFCFSQSCVQFFSISFFFLCLFFLTAFKTVFSIEICLAILWKCLQPFVSSTFHNLEISAGFESCFFYLASFHYQTTFQPNPDLCTFHYHRLYTDTVLTCIWKCNQDFFFKLQLLWLIAHVSLKTYIHFAWLLQNVWGEMLLHLLGRWDVISWHLSLP